MQHAFYRILLLSIACMATPLAVHSQTKTWTEKQKIEHLISTLEHLKGATFIRNGSNHDADEAASHLRMKVNYAGDDLETVEQFISEIASKSSWSGKAYQIKLASGKVLTSEEFLRNELKKLLDPKQVD